MPLVTRPTGLRFTDWGAQIVLDLEVGGLASIPSSEEAWQEWARGVVQIPQVSRYNPPNPFFYDKWLNWAEHFVIGVQ